MAEIKRRSAGEAGWAYDVGGKTYYTEAEAQRALAALERQAAAATATTSDTATRVVEDTSQMTMNGEPFNNAQTQQQQQTQYNSVEEYIQAETNRILADSNTFNDDEVVNVIYDRGYRAVTKNGEMGARRDTREEAIASAEKSFQIGQKVAETAEQRAQLLQLATKAKHFGGNSVNMSQVTDLVYQAIPEAGRTEAFFTAGNIRPAVSYNKRGQVYTSYGKELDIVLEKIPKRDDYRFAIVSPEGVKLTTTSLDPKDLIGFGLDTNKIKSAIDTYKQIKPNGVLPGNSNILYDAISNNLSGSDYLSRLQEQSKRPGGFTISTDGGPPRTVTQEKTGRYKGFGFYPGMADTFKDEEQFLNNVYTQINRTLAGALLYGAVVDTADFRPSYTQESYLQTLNQTYGTPNNNITFGPEGLQYTFADGYSTVWGQQLNRLDVLSAMIGVQINSPNQGKMFKDAQNFNTLEDYDAWKSTQEPTKVPVTTVQEPTVSAPVASTVPSTTEPTGTTGIQTTQAVGPTTYQQQQPVSQQPVAPPSAGVPTGIQTPTGIIGTYPQSTTPGTSTVPSQTAGFSSVPTTIPAQQPGVSGFSPQQLTSTMPGMGGAPVGVQTVNYSNQFGQTIPVTESNGQPITYVPPGYSRTTAAAQGGLMRTGYAEGGQSQDKMLEAKYRIASMNGYNGPKTNQALDAFANASPGMTAKFNAIGAALAKGGYIRKAFAPGGLATLEDFQGMQQGLVTQTMQPRQAPVAMIQPTAEDFIPTTAGQVSGAAPFAETATVPTTAQAGMPVMTPASFMQPTAVTPQVQQATDQLQAAQGQVAPEAQVQAAQQATTSVTGMQAAQGAAILMDNPVQRQIQAGELITGAADAQTAAAFTEQVQAATATPSKQATVQGQLEGLMQQFEGGNTPAWAAASMRNATAILAARGLGASSLAGQAVIQAAMEAALPIAQMDAQIQSQFEAQNLSNRQQRAMLAAQQRAEFLGMEFTQEFQARVQNSARIGDIANMNFTAEQSIALENSRAANTVNLNNLSNRQAMVMAEAAALSQLDMQNLSNRQQAAVQNAQNFLQMDMANLSNEQQATMFKTQSVIQSLFTDQAAQNAAAQFNASSENQTNQFFASLASNTSQFNAVQQNAMDQFNVDAVNSLRQFNSQIQQQRDMFNAQNGLVIAQANAQWRQNIATLNTAAQNQSNMDFAKTINALTSTNLDQIWQRERDMLSMAYQSAESNADRALSITLQKMAADATIEAAKFQADVQADIAKGKGWADVFTSVIGSLF